MRIDEGQFVGIFGVDQWITLRGSDSNNPPLLIVSGPGASFSQLTPFFEPWENAFTLVQWDQPGAGGTQAKNGDAGSGELSYARLARDGIAVAEFVCRRLRVDKIALLGISGGSIVALTMVKQRPDLFFAYVGTGQIINWARQETLSYAMVLEQARALANAEAVAELEKLGPPPYPDAAADAVKSKYANTLTPAELAVFASLSPDVMAAINSPPADARYVAPGLPVPDVMTTAMAAYAKLRNELVAFDARALGLDFAVPMFFFQGDRDAFTVVSLVEGFAADIRAPQKALELIEGGGHSAFFIRDTFFELLVRFVKPLAGPKAR